MTAFATGSVTPTGGQEGHDLLLTELRDFLTTNVTLVAANEHWVVEKEETIATYTMSGVSGTQTYTGSFRDLYLRGPGLSQSDNIHVNLRQYQRASTSMFNWAIQGATSFDTLENWEDQPNNSLMLGHFSYFPLTNAQIDYTFVANGRRFIVVVTIDGDTYVFYAGFILPYALPSEYPYPLAITGTTTSIEKPVTDSATQNFWTVNSVPKCSIRTPDGTWTILGGTSATTSVITWPWDDANIIKLRSNLDGTFTLYPGVLYTLLNGGNCYGEWDGVFYTPKFGVPNLAAGDVITIDTVDYFVLQNGQRTDEYEYGAVRKS